MPYGVVLVFDGVGEDDYWKVNDALGIARDSDDGYPDGLLSHTAGASPAGWLVAEVWSSKATQEAFMAERLGAALAAAGMPQPAQMLDFETANYRTGS